MNVHQNIKKRHECTMEHLRCFSCLDRHPGVLTVLPRRQPVHPVQKWPTSTLFQPFRSADDLRQRRDGGLINGWYLMLLFRPGSWGAIVLFRMYSIHSNNDKRCINSPREVKQSTSRLGRNQRTVCGKTPYRIDIVYIDGLPCLGCILKQQLDRVVKATSHGKHECGLSAL